MQGKEKTRQLLDWFQNSFPSPCSSRSATPVASIDDLAASKSSTPSVSEFLPLTVGSPEPLDTKCGVYELPNESSDGAPGNQPEDFKKSVLQSTEAALVNTALADRIKVLVADNC